MRQIPCPARLLPYSGGGELDTGVYMLWTLAIVLFILWILGFGVFHAAGALIHLLLVAAVIVILIRLIQGRRPVV